MELLVGPGEDEAEVISSDATGTVQIVKRMNGKSVLTQHAHDEWQEELTLDSPQVAWRLIDNDFWALYRALLDGSATVVKETDNTLTVKPNLEGSSIDEAKIDRLTHLPLVVQSSSSGTRKLRYEYTAIEMLDEKPARNQMQLLTRSVITKMDQATAASFNKFPLYYLGQSFGAFDLARIQYTYQDLRMSHDVEVMIFDYLPPGDKSGPAPVSVVVKPKTAETMQELAEMKAQGGLDDGEIESRSPTDFVMLAILDDAIVYLTAPEELILHSMRSHLQRVS